MMNKKQMTNLGYVMEWTKGPSLQEAKCFQVTDTVLHNLYRIIYSNTLRMDLMTHCGQNSMFFIKHQVICHLPSRLRKEPEEKDKDTLTGC